MYDLLYQEMCNFVTHKKTKIDFSKMNSVYIYGENRDNKSMTKNGCGKSLILDAICWCLTGKTIRGGAADSIIGQFMKYAYGIQVWKNENRYLKIQRYRKHPKHRNRAFIYSSEDGASWTEDLSKETVGDTDLYLQKLFGVDHSLFVAGVPLTKPHQSLDFCEAKDTKRKEVLTNLLNLSWIDEAKEKAKSELNSHNTDLKELTSELEYSDESFINLNKEYEEAISKSSGFKESIDLEINKRLDEIKKIRSVNKKNYSALISKYEKIKNVYLMKHKVLEKLNDESITMRSKIENILQGVEKLESEVKVLERKKLSNEKKDFIEGDLCEECGSSYHKKNIHILLNAINESIKKLKHEIKFQYVLSTEMINKREKLISKIDKYSKYKMSNISNIDDKINVFKEKMIQQKHDLKDVSRLKKEISELKARNNPWLEIENKKLMRMKKIDSKVDKIKTLIKKTKTSIKYAEAAVEAYGNSGIKNDIISSKIQLLEEKINYYLAKIADGDIFIKLTNKVRHGQSERIGIIIQDGKKKNPLDYLYWSGGERCRIKFAVEWAINSIMEAPINLLFIDEGFDNLDPSGIKIILDMMREEKKRVICISNLSSMKNIFNDSIKVVLENQTSRVEA